MYQSLIIALLLLAMNPAGPHPPAHATHAASVPVVGRWELVGTAPPGFVRRGTQVAQIALTLQGKKLHALVSTGRHHYAAAAQYRATRHELVLQVPTSAGRVHLDATLVAGKTRMVGTWYDARGDDGGFVLLRLAPPRS